MLVKFEDLISKTLRHDTILKHIFATKSEREMGGEGGNEGKGGWVSIIYR